MTWIMAWIVMGINAHAAPPVNEEVYISNSEQVVDFVSVADLRRYKRVGISTQVGGSTGLFGLGLELNLSERFSLQGNFGGGPNYQAFSIGVKRLLGSESFSPYISGGVTRWYNSSSGDKSINKTTPSFLGDKLLTSKQHSSGQFSKTFLFPAAGIQFVQLNGSWSGVSIFGELLVLLDIAEFRAAPTGSFGATYYF